MSRISIPLVSIIIPVFNGSNYLGEAIESALNQTYDNCEIIVVNDGSSDYGLTRDIALSFQDKIRYFEKQNGGVSSALNLGIEKMQGEFFSWLSHDDVYDSRNIETQINFIKNCPGRISVCKTGILIGSIYSKFSENHKFFLYNKPLDALNQWIYACSLLIPKEVVFSIGGLNETNKTTQDVEFIWKLLFNYELYFLNTTLVFRRVHKDQGYQVVEEKNLEELLNLIDVTLRTNGVQFFLNNSSASNLEKIKTYLILAFHFQKDKRDTQSKISKVVLEHCRRDFPSLFNPCNLILKFLYVFKYYVWGYMFIKIYASKIYRLFTNN